MGPVFARAKHGDGAVGLAGCARLAEVPGKVQPAVSTSEIASSHEQTLDVGMVSKTHYSSSGSSLPARHRRNSSPAAAALVERNSSEVPPNAQQRCHCGTPEALHALEVCFGTVVSFPTSGHEQNL
mmetsp:Transcript_63133/g.150511  ORF Transcript_63133/g.150511 Transcript_63133/m.150511 type:complete len:126 (-) Transcript_63133:632-1009(-)